MRVVLVKNEFMKHQFFTLALLIGTILLINACKKQKAEPILVEDNLTSCGGKNCSYLFYEHKDLDSPRLNYKLGQFRVFEYASASIYTPNLQEFTKVFIKAQVLGTSFTLNQQELLSKVSFVQSCASCNMIGLKVKGGYAKGINLTPNKPADQTKWLIEAKLFLGVDGVSKAVDTLYIKQYFYPNFVYN